MENTTILAAGATQRIEDLLVLLQSATKVEAVYGPVMNVSRVQLASLTGEADNEVVRLSDSMNNSITFTELGLATAEIWNQVKRLEAPHQSKVRIEAQDSEGDAILLTLTYDEDAQPMVYAYVQEGGSAGELYLHFSSSEADAEEARASSADSGYQTTAAQGIPLALSLDTQIFDVMSTMLEALDNFEYAESLQEAA